MEFSLNTPALLFPAISLLLLAYTNRFLAVANLIRNLYARYKEKEDQVLIWQINNLRSRIWLIQSMQALGISSLFLCVLCMFLLFTNYKAAGEITFFLSLIMMMTSLGFSLREIHVSAKALNIQLHDLENPNSVENQLTHLRKKTKAFLGKQ